MAIATATAAAIATAAGSLGGAALANKGAGKAAKAQQSAASEAIAFEREREATRRAEHDKAQEMYRQQYQAWQQARQGLLKRYGMNLGQQPNMAQGRPAGIAPLTAGPPTMAPKGTPGMFRRGRSLADFGGYR